VDDDCPTCGGIGWVCESHRNAAWAFYAKCGCIGGFGVPCHCNAGNEPDASEVMDWSEIVLPNWTSSEST